MEGERLAVVEEQVRCIRDDVKEMRKDVKTLLEFKWKIYGMTAVIAFVVTYMTKIH